MSLYELELDSNVEMPSSNEQGAKPAAPAAKGKGGGPLVVGQFSVEPSEGTVQPGSKAEVIIVFKADGARVYR